MKPAQSLLITLCLLFFSACVKGPESNSGGGRGVKSGGPVRIGFSMDTLKEERWQRDKALVEQHCKEVGAQCDVLVADGNDATQINQAESFLTKGVDVLIVAPHNGQVAAAIVEAAHKQNVPVISYDRLIRNADVDLYVSHQVVKIGQMQAQYALDHQPKGNYVLIGGSQTDNNALLLTEGRWQVLQPAIDK
jgi:D-xylose transport system substrate-binding protein